MAALVLAQRGRRVLLVDGSMKRGTKIGEVLPPSAAAHLRAVGEEALLNHRKHLQVAGGQSSWGQAECLDRDLSFDPRGTAWHLDRRIFDADLCAAARRRGVDHALGTRFRRAQAPADGRGWIVELDSLGEMSSAFVIDATGRASSFARSRGVRRRRHDRLVALVASLDVVSDFEFLIEAAPSGWWYAAALPAGRAVAAFLTDADLIPAGRRAQRDFWIERLDDSVHIRSRISIHPDLQIRTVAAQTERIDSPVGPCWVAVGDAAVSFDPLSSLGLTHALETGRLAGLAVDAALAGEERPLEAYARHVRRRAENSEILRSAYYGMEARWPESPFWARRRRWVRQ